MGEGKTSSGCSNGEYRQGVKALHPAAAKIHFTSPPNVSPKLYLGGIERMLGSTNFNLINSKGKKFILQLFKKRISVVGGVHEFIIYNMFTNLYVLI